MGRRLYYLNDLPESEEYPDGFIHYFNNEPYLANICEENNFGYLSVIGIEDRQIVLLEYDIEIIEKLILDKKYNDRTNTYLSNIVKIFKDNNLQYIELEENYTWIKWTGFYLSVYFYFYTLCIYLCYLYYILI